MESSQSTKTHTNRLIDETSPYLLQHAHNPVDWYPWGEEAFKRARAEDKPVLVSIGYSACHWCHVMEHESFEDEAVAAVQNEHFINIKVDMEERPDVDQIYMNFVQITTGRGGWPMNVFITPEKLPFFGGTYFPPMPRYGMPSWRQILLGIAEAWNERRDELIGSAFEILESLKKMSRVEMASGGIDESLSETAFKSFVRTFDPLEGGWGGAPKFPGAMSMEFLLRYWKRTGNENALEMVRHTATKMACGGIYDQLGGGFHRYSVDAVWLVPHFEKMLYDNAQLIRIYLHLFQILRSDSGGNLSGSEGALELAGLTTEGTLPTGRVSVMAGHTAEFFKQVAIETLEYVRREITDASGVFYSTQDADSEGEEGKFFVWTPDEIAQVLGEKDAKEFCEFYDVSASGNFEGSNILNIPGTSQTGNSKLKTEDRTNNFTSSELSVLSLQSEKDRFLEMRNRLFEHREGRIKPNRDEKVLTAWNGLMLAAFAEAAAVLNEPKYLEAAKANADFLLSELVRDGRVLRTWKDGRAKLNGYVEDYANLADGLIELFQVGGDERYLAEARRLADAMITEFWDEENGGFFFTSNDHEELIVRNKDFYDNATPSGNSVAADVLLKLARLTGDERYERFGATVLRIAATQIRTHPQGFGRALSAIEFYIANVQEIVVVGAKGNELERELWSDFRPFKVAMVTDGSDSELELLNERTMVDGKAAAYVCEGFVCQRPVTSARELKDLLG